MLFKLFLTSLIPLGILGVFASLVDGTTVVPKKWQKVSAMVALVFLGFSLCLLSAWIIEVIWTWRPFE